MASHLVCAGELLDDDPEAARAHAVFARALAGRVAAVREAAGITAYLTGDYAEALAELRAVARMTGRVDHLPVMADCERGLGRPERALKLASSPEARRLGREEQVELRIVASGARRDMGEFDAAVVALQGPDLEAGGEQDWAVRLRYAYADALLAAGRADDAKAWFAAAAAIDDDELTDASERLAQLDG